MEINIIKEKERISELVEIWNKKYPKKNKIKPIDKNILLRSRINGNMGSSIWDSIKNNKEGRHWEDLVDYTLTDLIKHLKNTMLKGYTWQNYLEGKLHIDHIIPKKAFAFTKPENEGFKMCWSLHNLRLLPASKNKSKQDRITNPILLGLLIKEFG